MSAIYSRAFDHFSDDIDDAPYSDPEHQPGMLGPGGGGRHNLECGDDEAEYNDPEAAQYIDFDDQFQGHPAGTEKVQRRPHVQRAVSLEEEYSQPSDRLSRPPQTRNSSQDYTEPYHTQGGLVKREAQAPKLPVEDIYELAKNVHDPHEQQNTAGCYGDGQYNKLGQLMGQMQGVNITSSTHMSESYDHLNSWSHNSTAQVTPGSPGQGSKPQARTGSSGADDVFTSPGPPHIPPNYEEPWDSEIGQKRFHRIVGRAEKQHERRQSNESSAPSQVLKQQTNMDTRNESAPKRTPPTRPPPTVSDRNQRSRHAEGNVYETAWVGMSAGQNQGQSSVSASQSEVKPTIRPSLPPGTLPSNYEDAWDLPEKQKEFEAKLQLARKKRESEGQIHVQDTKEEGAGNESRFSRKSGAVPPTEMRRVDSCQAMYALAEKVDMYIPLKEQVFYHGRLKRSEAERMLNVFKEGSYLVRCSETSRNDYSLTLNMPKKIVGKKLDILAKKNCK
ncbi:SHF-like protein [Mya arenaria]|uniref:SHF-like protein n=1 Tax=Mya arenaria TaxID=6604 RepID=A0ABY7DMP4_MYAAR|nr:SHF-like protein [Mya arenaria]